MSISTPDLCDDHGDKIRVMHADFKHYGGRQNFYGEVTTIKCFEDNSRVAEMVKEPGRDRVLVVDGGASPRHSLLGDKLAKAAADNGWRGIVIYGYLRDVEELATMPIGILALGSVPLKTEKRGEGRCDITLNFAGTSIHPGDHLYADLTGTILSSTPLLD